MMQQTKGSVFMIPKEIVVKNEAKLVKLRNPATKEASFFIINKEEKMLYEVQDFDEKHRSWIMNKNIYSDGSIKIVTKYNPIFLILPYLMQTERNIPLDQLLEDDEFPSMTCLVDIVEDLSYVADRKGPENLNVWKFNESLTLDWLTSKIDKLAVYSQENHERPSLTCSISTDKELYRVLAFGILSENLCKELSVTLKRHLKLPEPTVENEIGQEHNKENKKEIKKAKIENNTEEETPNQTKKTPVIKQSAKEKALAKSAKGSKSITSFFVKKK